MSSRAQPERAPRVFVAVGSNIEPAVHVCRALRLLIRRVRVDGVSTFYRTAALGRAGQADFVNGVWALRTELAPRQLKEEILRDIERRLGRRRSADKHADRPIDLDLVLYGALVSPELGLPDPEIRTRNFVALPLLELEPEQVLPDTGERLISAAASMTHASMTPLPALTRKQKRMVGL